MQEGSNIVKVFCNDTAQNQGEANVSFLIDTIAPIVTITSPINTTYNNAIQLVNISTSVANYTWFFNGTVNVTYISPVFVTFLEGSNTLIVYANDSVGNINTTRVTFTIDTTAPDLSIISPINTTYNNATQLVNISTTGANYTWFFNGTVNVTYISPVFVTFLEGSSTLIAYVNDSLGNINSTRVTFTINTTILDTTAPIVTITSPTNTTYNTLNITLSGTTNENATCRYSLNDNLTISLGSSPFNTSILVQEGSNIIKVFCNDTSQNQGEVNISFLIDTTVPSVSAPTINNLGAGSDSFIINTPPIVVPTPNQVSVTNETVDNTDNLEIVPTEQSNTGIGSITGAAVSSGILGGITGWFVNRLKSISTIESVIIGGMLISIVAVGYALLPSTNRIKLKKFKYKSKFRRKE